MSQKKPTAEQIKARAQKLLYQELYQPERWHYVSFADRKSFRGGVYVKAKGIVHAHLLINSLGINPGGEMLCVEIPEVMEKSLPPEAYRHRLLSKQDLLAIHKEGMVKLDGSEVR